VNIYKDISSRKRKC